MLSVKNIVVFYGGVQALKGVSLEVQKSTVIGLIGSNGAGKSTTLRAISGLVPIRSGEIWFGRRRIDGSRPERIVSLGIVHVPEGKRLFLKMSVLDNLLAGAYLRRDTDRLGKDLERIFSYFPVLKRACYRLASQLSGGEQQMLAIGRGLMANPKMLLLDEPSLGLSPLLTKEVGTIIKRIANEGVSILLIEQNANLAFQLVKKVYVMETGTIVLEGTPAELQNDPHVREAYLGLSPVGKEELVTARPEALGSKPSGPGRVERWQDKLAGVRFQEKVSGERWQGKGAGTMKERPILQGGDFEKEREIGHELNEDHIVAVRRGFAYRPTGHRRAFETSPDIAKTNGLSLREYTRPSGEQTGRPYAEPHSISGKSRIPDRALDIKWKGQRQSPPRIIKKIITPAIRKTAQSRKD